MRGLGPLRPSSVRVVVGVTARTATCASLGCAWCLWRRLCAGGQACALVAHGTHARLQVVGSDWRAISACIVDRVCVVPCRFHSCGARSVLLQNECDNLECRRKGGVRSPHAGCVPGTVGCQPGRSCVAVWLHSNLGHWCSTGDTCWSTKRLWQNYSLSGVVRSTQLNRGR